MTTEQLAPHYEFRYRLRTLGEYDQALVERVNDLASEIVERLTAPGMFYDDDHEPFNVTCDSSGEWVRQLVIPGF